MNKTYYIVTYNYLLDKKNDFYEQIELGCFSSNKKASEFLKNYKEKYCIEKYKRGFSINKIVIDQHFWDGGFYAL